MSLSKPDNNLYDSLLFLMSVRTSLNEFVQESEIPKQEKSDFGKFILFEASDYEIMSILVNDEIPKEKYNSVKEEKLFEDFRLICLENLIFLEELIGSKPAKDITFKLYSINESGISSRLDESVDFLVESGRYLQSKEFDFLREDDAIVPTVMKAWDVTKREVGGIKNLTKFGIAKFSERFPTIHSALSWTYSHKIPLTAAMLSAIILYGSIQSYRKIWSKSAKQCKAFLGKAKDECMMKHKIDALRTRATEIQSFMGACSKSKDPAKCRETLRKKVDEIHARIDKKEEKFKKRHGERSI